MLKLLAGMGRQAQRLLEAMARGSDLSAALAGLHAAGQRSSAVAGSARLLLGRGATPGRARWAWCGSGTKPRLERMYDAAAARGDLEQLEQLSRQLPQRARRFLTELTLDPPSTSDLAGPPLLDEDYLILSTIHSAKGQEWDIVYVLNVPTAAFPSDMAAGNAEEMEENGACFTWP